MAKRERYLFLTTLVHIRGFTLVRIQIKPQVTTSNENSVNLCELTYVSLCGFKNQKSTFNRKLIRREVKKLGTANWVLKTVLIQVLEATF